MQRWQCWCNPLIFPANLVLCRSIWAYYSTVITEIHVSGLLTNRLTNKSEKRNLINRHALSCEPVL